MKGRYLIVQVLLIIMCLDVCKVEGWSKDLQQRVRIRVYSQAILARIDLLSEIWSATRLEKVTSCNCVVKRVSDSPFG